MKMDTSKWTNLNPCIQFKRTQKKYYNRFSIKLIYTIKGASRIAYARNHDDVEYRYRLKFVDRQIKTTEQFKYLCYLKDLFDVINKVKQVARVRIESDTVAIFGTEDVLENLTNGLLSTYNHLLKTVYLVSSEQEQKLIDQGYILLRRPTDYQYRVNIRSGYFSSDSGLKSFLEYANNLPEDIQMTDYLKYRIRSGHKYFSGSYFYIKDLKVLSMIMLIEPTLVKSYQKIKVIQ